MNSRAVFITKFVISVSLIAYLLNLVNFSSVVQQFADLILVYVMFAVLLLLCQSFLSAFKWRTLLSADGVSLKYLYLLKTYLISNFISLFLPTSFGGDIYRVMSVRKAAMSTAKTTSSVLFDRLTGLLALLSLACIGYLTIPGQPYKWLVVAVYLLGLLTFCFGVSRRIQQRLNTVRSRPIAKLVKIIESFRTYAANPRCMVTAILVSFAFQLNVIFINKMYSLAFGLEIPFTTLLAVIPLVYLTEAIPMSINGLGFREGAFVFFYQLIGQSAEAGLGVALLVLTLRYSMGLIGGLLLVEKIVSDRFKSGKHDSGAAI